jgi:hypothetical protein
VIEIPEMTGLTFDEEKHYYRHEGKYIPSVTTIMRPLSADAYKDIDEEVVRRAAERGTAVHESIENYIKFGFADGGEYQNYLDGFLSWNGMVKPEYVSSEMRGYHPLYRYAGTTDALCYITVNGKKQLYIIDFKTTAVMHNHLVKVQLEAYSRALIAHGIPVQAAGALQLKKDGSFEFLQFEVNNSEYWGVFCSLLTVHQYIQKNKQWNK